MGNLELRMYFFVPYNISEIQKGIQAGHASLEYAKEFGNSELFLDFVENHKTWIILNGGTTNNNPQNPGSIQEIKRAIDEFNNSYEHDELIDYTIFKEPDLNDAITAICFICDERVFNNRQYETFDKFESTLEAMVKVNLATPEELANAKKLHEETVGGAKNAFLKELIRGKKLA